MPSTADGFVYCLLSIDAKHLKAETLHSACVCSLHAHPHAPAGRSLVPGQCLQSEARPLCNQLILVLNWAQPPWFYFITCTHYIEPTQNH